MFAGDEWYKSPLNGREMLERAEGGDFSETLRTTVVKFRRDESQQTSSTDLP